VTSLKDTNVLGRDAQGEGDNEEGQCPGTKAKGPCGLKFPGQDKEEKTAHEMKRKPLFRKKGRAAILGGGVTLKDGPEDVQR